MNSVITPSEKSILFIGIFDRSCLRPRKRVVPRENRFSLPFLRFANDQYSFHETRARLYLARAMCWRRNFWDRFCVRADTCSSRRIARGSLRFACCTLIYYESASSLTHSASQSSIQPHLTFSLNICSYH